MSHGDRRTEPLTPEEVRNYRVAIDAAKANPLDAELAEALRQWWPAQAASEADVNSKAALGVLYSRGDNLGRVAARWLQARESKPNETTLETFKATDDGRELVECEDAEGMFKKLGIEGEPEEEKP